MSCACSSLGFVHLYIVPLVNILLFYRLAKQDMVFTTFGLVNGDYKSSEDRHDMGPLFKVKWRRVILDEAHQIRNPKSQASIAVCHLSAKSRWALTGTPIHNKELDLYALLKFLRCSPFDDLPVRFNMIIVL